MVDVLWREDKKGTKGGGAINTVMCYNEGNEEP